MKTATATPTIPATDPTTDLGRRSFLRVSALGGGGLLIGLSLGCKAQSKDQGKDQKGPPAGGPSAPTTEPDAPAGEPVELNAWVSIQPDDTVTLRIHRSEMGQGVLTSLAMILAEELEADWSKVRAEHAPADAQAYGRQGTGGSSSVRGNFEPLRKAGAAVREMLVAAAARRWSVEPATCRARDSVVSHDSGKQARYGELLADVAGVTPPQEPALKNKKDFRLIGKPVPRLDTPDKVTGAAVFGIDVKRPGMVTAQVVHCPIFGGKPAKVDSAAARAVPGVLDVVEIPTGVAVVGRHFWAASQGRKVLNVEWDPGESGSLSTASITEAMRAVVKKGKDARKDGDPAAVLRTSRRRLEAVYEVPYLAHAAMEPLSCTAEVSTDSCTIWTSTQSQTSTQQVASKITGLPADKIAVHTMMLGGGFGRRSTTDFVADAVHLAKAVGKPVQVVWSREDDIQGGSYRPAAYNELAGAIDDKGRPVAWVHRIASPSIVHVFGPLKDGIDGTSVEGAANLPYAIDNIQVTYARPEVAVSTWFWRSVGSSQNAFVTECFFDELCALGGTDPVQTRLELLADKPRHKRVLELAADKAGWGTPLGEGRARGVAVHESFGSFVAQVAEVSMEGGSVRVHRVVCVVDCGDIINPDIVVAQMESGIVYGLSAALYGKIDIEKGQAVQSNFHDYRVLRMPQMPVIETHISTTGEPLGGIGEPGTPPIAPAVANAMRALTGKPVRRLPIIA